MRYILIAVLALTINCSKTYSLNEIELKFGKVKSSKCIIEQLNTSTTEIQVIEVNNQYKILSTKKVKH